MRAGRQEGRGSKARENLPHFEAKINYAFERITLQDRRLPALEEETFIDTVFVGGSAVSLCPSLHSCVLPPYKKQIYAPHQRLKLAASHIHKNTASPPPAPFPGCSHRPSTVYRCTLESMLRCTWISVARPWVHIMTCWRCLGVYPPW